jgi:hypothetical protein
MFVDPEKGDVTHPPIAGWLNLLFKAPPAVEL